MKNRKKPILAVVAGAIVIAVCAAIGVDETTAAAIAVAVSGFVAERVGPVFGSKARTPEN